MRRLACLSLSFLLSSLLTVVAGANPVEQIEGLDSLSSATLLRALDRLGIDPPELGFDKLYAEDDTFRLAIVEDLLNDPLRIPGWQSSTVDRARYAVTDPAALVEYLGELCEADEHRVMSFYKWPSGQTEVPAALDHPRSAEDRYRLLKSAVDSFVDQCRDAESWCDHAFERLTDIEIRTLLTLAPAFWGDSDHPADKVLKGALHFETGTEVDTTIEMSEKLVLDAATRLERSSLTHAAQVFQIALLDFSSDLRHLPIGNGSVTHDGITGALVAVEETPWGLLVVGGRGQNTYSAEALVDVAFIFDLGGDDVYRGRAASAVGGLMRPLSAVVDFGGSDLYDADERSYVLGGALLGVASLIDLAGDDIYRGGDGSLGAGFFGAGFLYDRGGSDFFSGRNLCQGSGAFGLGALISDAEPGAPPAPDPDEDRAFTEGLVKVPGTGAVPVRYDENDTYRCARQSQGFASTFGAGLLYDKTGNDTYRSGGYYLHAPLRPHDFQSLSQGFSIGFRPRASGGVGILIDEEGNDFYSSEVYAQGVSYWYSIGLLHDRSGNDRYHATQYAQGAGVHLAVGSLWDVGGDDHYVSQFGVTQGTAHDLSAGLLLDEGGNDYYLVSDGQGMSITNSVAIFIDSQGDDLYATHGRSQGTSNWARGFCGAGIFLDLEGSDRYPDGAGGADGAVWSQEVMSIGIDLDRDVRLPDEAIPDPVLTKEDSLRTVEELFETASIWEVGSAREKVRRARKALKTKGIDAVDYVVAEKLGTDSGLEYRAIKSLAEEYPDSFTVRVIPRLADENKRIVSNVIRLLGDMKRTDAAAPLTRMLNDERHEKHWTRIIWALGRIGDGSSAPAVRPFLEDDVERRRIGSVVAISALRDTLSVPALVDRLADPILTVRTSANRALRTFGAAAIGPLVGELSPDADQRRLVIETLGDLAIALKDSTDAASVEARSLAWQALVAELDRASEYNDPFSRAIAVESLMRRGDLETIGIVERWMESETDPLVLRSYERFKDLGDR